MSTDDTTHIHSLNDIRHAYYINLTHRVDRREHIVKQLSNVNIRAQRFNAIRTSNGAIGCSLSHLNLLEMAMKQKLPHILIIEDDLTFTNPGKFVNQFNNFAKKHSKWDVVLFGGNNGGPTTTIDDTCVKVEQCQTTTGYLVNGHYIKTLYENVRLGLLQLMRLPRS